MEMIERVAKALAASDEAEPLFACACLGKEDPADFACPCKMRAARRRAKVAIEALRVPTDDMVEAILEPGWRNSVEVWQAGIDAALKS